MYSNCHLICENRKRLKILLTIHLVDGSNKYLVQKLGVDTVELASERSCKKITSYKATDSDTLRGTQLAEELCAQQSGRRRDEAVLLPFEDSSEPRDF